jgi:hypothetical protein
MEEARRRIGDGTFEGWRRDWSRRYHHELSMNAVSTPIITMEISPLKYFTFFENLTFIMVESKVGK